MRAAGQRSSAGSRYPQKHFESRFTRFYEGYWLPKKFGLRHAQGAVLEPDPDRADDPGGGAREAAPGRRTTRRRSRTTSSTWPRSSASRRRSCRRYMDAPNKTYRDYKSQERIYLRRREGDAAARAGAGRQAMIAIVDYGLGNVQAIANIYKRLNIPAIVASAPQRACARPSEVILPGVGAFDWAMDAAERARACAQASIEVRARGAQAGARHLRRHADAGASKRGGRACRASAGSTGEVRKFDVTRFAAGRRTCRTWAGTTCSVREQSRAVRRARRRRPILFPALLLFRAAQREPTCWRRPTTAVCLPRASALAQRLRCAVPSREEPPVGHSAPAELRRALAMLRPRIIPCLLVQERRSGEDRASSAAPKYVGDPINAVRIFNEKEVDELIVLDIDATAQGREPDYAHDQESRRRVPHAAVLWRRCHAPSSRSERIISLGVEKVAISSAAVDRPGARGAGWRERVGRPERRGRPRCEEEPAYRRATKCGRTTARARSGDNPLSSSRGRCEERGAGEIVVNSIDHDGAMKGYDVDARSRAVRAVGRPLPITRAGRCRLPKRHRAR